MKNLIYYISFILFLTLNLYGQDSYFSQHFTAPMFNNPANTGYYKGLKARTHYHDQWRGVSNRTKTINLSVEFSGREMPGGGGIGLIINSVPEFDGIIKTSIGLAAASRIQLSEKWIAQFGFSTFYVHNDTDIDREKFVWSKQLDNRHGLLYPQIPISARGTYNHRYFDLNIGGILGYESEFRAARLGFSVHHVTHPNVAFFTDNTVRLPLRYSIEGDFAIVSRKNIYGVAYHPSFLVELQGNIPSINAGINFAKSIFYLGIFYHQSSFTRSFKTITPDMGIMIPLNDKTQRLKIGYSYEIPLQVAGDIGGVHEVTIRFEYDALQLIRSWKLFPIGNPDLKKRLHFL